MSDMSWEHASEARAALNAIVSDPEHGVAALSNAQTMSNLLKDYLPDAPREKSILVAAAEAGLADTLREHVSQGMDPSTAIRLTASSFSSSTPFTSDACNWVTDEIAVALGISQGRSPGNDPFGGGQFGNQPPGYPSTGNEGTQMAGGAPGYPSGQPSNLGGGGYPQSPGQGFGAGQPGPQEQPTAQGYSPGYGPQGGGFGGGVAAGLAALVRLRLAASASPGYPASPPSPAAIRVSRPIRSLAALAARPGSQAASRPSRATAVLSRPLTAASLASRVHLGAGRLVLTAAALAAATAASRVPVVARRACSSAAASRWRS